MSVTRRGVARMWGKSTATGPALSGGTRAKGPGGDPGPFANAGDAQPSEVVVVVTGTL